MVGGAQILDQNTNEKSAKIYSTEQKMYSTDPISQKTSFSLTRYTLSNLPAIKKKIYQQIPRQINDVICQQEKKEKTSKT